MKERDIEICRFYFALINTYQSEGDSFKDAKRKAMDATSLRYNISNYRIRIIIAENIRKDDGRYISSILCRNGQLISVLKSVLKFREEELEQINGFTLSNAMAKSVAGEYTERLEKEVSSIRQLIDIINEADNYERARLINRQSQQN